MSDDIPALIAEARKVAAYHGPFSMTNRLADALEAEHELCLTYRENIKLHIAAANKAQARIADLEAALTKADEFIDFYFSPWGAAKSERWESETNDAPFTAENALRKLKREFRAVLERAE